MADWSVNLIIGLVAVLVTAGIAAIGAAVAWGRVKQTLANHAEKFAAVSNEVAALKRGLYNGDGTLVYIPAGECEKRRLACARNQESTLQIVCHKIDELREDLKTRDERRDTEVKELRNAQADLKIAIAAQAGKKD